jgi:ferric-dicitrate binding protein FerR (iron transport regulator)
MDKKLVEKFFVNQTTPEETRRVLDWFETPEGKGYLHDRLNIDYELMDRKELREMVPNLESDELYQSIQDKIVPKRKKVITHKSDWVEHAFKAAAAILVILTASLFTFNQQRYADEQVVEREPIHFQTNNEVNREITLSDGSVIRLNKNSEVIISEDIMHGTREIELKGEAFFDVAHNPDQPFIIHANHSTVQVLGTAFNVRSVPEEENVQVAVVEGRVSFTNKMAIDTETQQENGVVLTKGQYAYMDIQNSRFQVDDVAVRNYLAWNSGTFEFEDLTLQQVCTQLSRLYGLECTYSDEQIQNLLLTASFTNESVEKTLEVIALSLDIEYEHDEESVHWRM